MTDDQGQETRELLGSELEATERGTYEKLDAIPDAVDSVPLWGVAFASMYLRARVPTARFGDVKAGLVMTERDPSKAPQ